MFADLDETIRQILIKHVPLDLTEVDVAFNTPDRDWSGRLSRPTVNCFLFDVHENRDRRQAEWEVARDPVTRTVTRVQGPLLIDATYYLTVWARVPEDEHQLLWRLLATLARFPKLPVESLAGSLANQSSPVCARVAQQDNDRPSATDLWQALDNRVRPSLSYVVTLALDPTVVISSPLVLTRHVKVDPFVLGTRS